MVAREDRVESAPVIAQVIPNRVSDPAVTEVSQPAKKIAVNEPVARLGECSDLLSCRTFSKSDLDH